MLTVTRPMGLAAPNETNATFSADRQCVSPCSGMDRCVGELGYDAAPAGAPTVEFSMNGSDWDFLKTIGLDPDAAPGVTLYTWDLQIKSWAFVRVTIPFPPSSIRGTVQILPKVQN